jgi:ABC-type Mn2+/Zn2+ transport system permease subunit
VTAVGRAAAEAVLLGVVGGLISPQIVLRRLPFFTIAMSHATFSGVVLAAIVGINLYAGAGLFGVLIVLGVLALSRRPEGGTTTATGIMLAAGFAFGVVLLSAQDGFTKDLTAFTVGQILTVTDTDLIAVAAVGVLVLALLVVAGRQLTFRAFDPDGFTAAGYRPVVLDVTLLLMVQAVIVVAIPAVGVILAVAILVAPAAVARLWTRNVAAMAVVGVVVGAAGGLVGVLVSARYDVAAGGAITLTIGAMFAVSLAGTTAVAAVRRILTRRSQSPRSAPAR